MDRNTFLNELKDKTSKDMIFSERMSVIDSYLDKYGEKNELLVCIEELSELQKELTKKLRSDSDDNALNNVGLLEELADVIISTQIIGRVYFDSETVNDAVQVKMHRMSENLIAEDSDKKHLHLSWRPISEYDPDVNGFVVVRLHNPIRDVDFIPEIMKRRDGIWYNEKGEEFDCINATITGFFDYKSLT